jgi:hypothetical protein
MNLDDILKMKAGRELDSLILKHVFGSNHDFDNCRWCKKDFDGDHYVRGNPHFSHYSTEISAAWEVVEKIMSMGYRYVFRGNFEGNGLHSVGFDEQDWADNNPLYKSQLCSSLPLAICKAALVAVMSKRGELEE